MGNLGKDVVKERKEELGNFLQIITKHENLMHDDELRIFLTLEESLESYIQNPSAFEKLKKVADYMPSISNLSLEGVKEGFTMA